MCSKGNGTLDLNLEKVDRGGIKRGCSCDLDWLRFSCLES